jgi:hypothetical protein
VLLVSSFVRLLDVYWLKACVGVADVLVVVLVLVSCFVSLSHFYPDLGLQGLVRSLLFDALGTWFWSLRFVSIEARFFRRLLRSGYVGDVAGPWFGVCPCLGGSLSRRMPLFAVCPCLAVCVPSCVLSTSCMYVCILSLYVCPPLMGMVPCVHLIQYVHRPCWFGPVPLRSCRSGFIEVSAS